MGETGSQNQTTPPVPIAPAPWTTKAECYWLVVTLGKTLPHGIYDPIEASSPEFADPNIAGPFEGGIGLIMIVRYKETPVGPYDELLIIPGNYNVPGKNDTKRRISRIYVNQKDTLFNGRYNWNIPKHLARFEFTKTKTPQKESMHLTVHPPSPVDAAPFFSCTITPFRWLPGTPFSTKYLPLSSELAQPPIPSLLEAKGKTSNMHGSSTATAKDETELLKRRISSALVDDDALVVGTQQWRQMPIEAYSKYARGAWVKIHEPGSEKPNASSEDIAKARGEATNWWPVNAKPWPVALWMDEAELCIPKPIEWKL